MNFQRLLRTLLVVSFAILTGLIVTSCLPNRPPHVATDPCPQNEAVDVPISGLTLSWSCSDPDGDELIYDVYFGTTVNPPRVAVGLETPSYNPGELAPGTTYYWKIVALTRSRFSWSEGPVWKFTTTRRPNVPVNPYPSNGAVNTSLSPVLTWKCEDPDGDPLEYEVHFGKESLPPTVAKGLEVPEYSPGILEPGTQYFWQVIARDDKGSEVAGPIWTFMTTNAPDVPQSPVPEDGEENVSIDSLILQWSCQDPDGDSLIYDLYLGTEPDPPYRARIESDSGSASYSASDLEPEATYFWRVVAYDTHNASSVGPIWSFSTTRLPAVPFNPSPKDGATEVDLKPVLKWESFDLDGDALTYDVYFGTTDNPPLGAEDLSTNTYIPGDLASNTVYYWKVVVKDGKGGIVEGPLWSFTTGDFSIPENTIVLDSVDLSEEIVEISDGAIVFRRGSLAESIEPGDVIVAGVSELTPYGLLKKVVDVSEQGDRVVLEVATAALSEAVDTGHIKAEIVLSPDNIMSEKNLTEGVGPTVFDSLDSVFRFDISVPLVDGKIQLEGSVEFVPTLFTEIDIKDSKLNFFNLHTVLQSTSELALAFNDDSLLEPLTFSIPLKEWTLHPLVFWIGVVPVVVVPQIDLVAEVKIDVGEISVRPSVSISLTSECGVMYDGASGEWDSYSSIDPELSWSLGEFDVGKLETEACVSAQFHPLLYGADMGYIGVGSCLRFVANPEATPWWVLYGGIKVPAEFEVEILDKVVAHAELNIYQDEWVLAQADVAVMNQRWKKGLGAQVINSPALSPSVDTLYVNSIEGKLFALNAETGEVKWTAETGSESYSDAVVDSAGNVYVTTTKGVVHCFRSDGSENWEYNADGLITSGVAIARDETIYFGTRNGELFALYSDGSLNWHVTGLGDIRTSPAIDSRGRVIVVGGNKVYAFSKEGSEEWGYELETVSECAPAIGVGDKVFVGTEDGYVHAINADGERLWNFYVGSPIKNGVIIGEGGMVYVFTLDGRVVAVNSAGEESWEQEISLGALTSATLDQGDLLTVADDRGNVYALSNSGVLYRFKTEAPVRGAPVLSENGKLFFVDSDGNAYCVVSNGMGPADSDWPMFKHDARRTSATHYVYNHPPNAPSSPSPGNGAVDQPTSLYLRWYCSDPDGDSLTYDLYFGTSYNPPLKASGLRSRSYYLSGLARGVTYYWKVVAKDGKGGITSGPVWRFTTVPPGDPPVVRITSPSDGQHFTNSNIHVQGTISNFSGSEAVLYLNGSPRTIPVQSDGSFDYELILEAGENTIKVEASNEYGTGSDQVVVYYDTATEEALWIELTWDKDSADIDLYVHEPDGGVVWYGNMTGLGELDRDDTDGYGPEHYTLTADRAISGTYTIRVHYYATNGQTSPINCTVVVKKYGSTVWTKHFTLSEANPENAFPGSTGPDWYDVGDVVLP